MTTVVATTITITAEFVLCAQWLLSAYWLRALAMTTSLGSWEIYLEYPPILRENEGGAVGAATQAKEALGAPGQMAAEAQA